MPTSTIIQARPSVVVLNGIQFLQYGGDYLDAATRLEPLAKQEGFSPIRYQLLCQSLELHLKAFIWLQTRIGTKAMKTKYGHDIQLLWQDSKVLGVDRYCRPTSRRDEAIRLLSPFYKSRQFAYFDLPMLFNGVRVLQTNPHALTVVKDICVRLGASLRPVIFEAAQS